MNEYEIDAELTEVFTKVSSFYSKDSTIYEGKFCSILLKNMEKGSNETVFEKQIDMAPFVNRKDEP